MACALNPDLKNKPVAVGGSKEDRHGIILAKNGPAKKYGVQTGEVLWQAKRKCPSLIIVPPQYDQYSKYSKLVRKIYERYTDQVESFGIDECWLDITGSTHLFGNGYEIAYKIKESIKNELDLTASIGVSFSKILAKLGSDIAEADSILEIKKDTFAEQIWHLPARALLGVGRRIEKRLISYGIQTIGDLASANPHSLKARLGINGYRLWEYANGLDQSTVSSVEVLRVPKSISCGITCFVDLQNNYEVKQVIIELAQSISQKMRKNNLAAQTVAIWLRRNTLGYESYQGRLKRPTQSFKDIVDFAYNLLIDNYEWPQNIRSVTIGIYDLIPNPQNIQLNFFEDYRQIVKTEQVELVIQKIRHRFGYEAIRPASSIYNLKMRSYYRGCINTLPSGNFLNRF